MLEKMEREVLNTWYHHLESNNSSYCEDSLCSQQLWMVQKCYCCWARNQITTRITILRHWKHLYTATTTFTATAIVCLNNWSLSKKKQIFSHFSKVLPVFLDFLADRDLLVQLEYQEIVALMVHQVPEVKPIPIDSHEAFVQVS